MFSVTPILNTTEKRHRDQSFFFQGEIIDTNATKPLRIWVVPGSNLAPEAGYPESEFPWVS
jgi:hypothetical protein